MFEYVRAPIPERVGHPVSGVRGLRENRNQGVHVIVAVKFISVVYSHFQLHTALNSKNESYE